MEKETCPGHCKENSKEIFLFSLSPAYYFTLSVLKHVLLLETFVKFVGEFLFRNFCQCKFLGTKCPLLIYLAPLLSRMPAPPGGSSTFPPWLLHFTDHFGSFITTSRMEHIALLVSLSLRQHYYCPVPVILNPTDEVLTACSLVSSNHILPVRNCTSPCNWEFHAWTCLP